MRTVPGVGAIVALAVEELENKVAVVTGGASGIGRGLCEAFAGAAMRVVVADIDAAGAEKVCAELRDRGAEALAVPTDVSDRAATEALAETAFREMGAVHVVCNNAGVIVGGALQEATPDDWEWVFSVNVRGIVNGCHAFAPRLAARGEGHIVNTASIGGLLSGPGLGVYCASKFAVVGFTDALRYELAPQGIGVSTLCPGGVRTNLLESDRNRPAHLGDAGGRADALKESLEAGIDSIVVGKCVVEGIRANARYIFTHPEFREGVESRFKEILAGFST